MLQTALRTQYTLFTAVGQNNNAFVGFFKRGRSRIVEAVFQNILNAFKHIIYLLIGKSFFGLPALREHILARNGTDASCGIGDVLITAGAAEANFLAISQLVQPGDEMIVDVPGWPQPLVLGEAIGAEVKRLPRYEDRTWRFDLNQLSELVSVAASAVASAFLR